MFECAGVHLCVLLFYSSVNSALRELLEIYSRFHQRTLIGSAGSNELEVDEVEMN